RHPGLKGLYVDAAPTIASPEASSTTSLEWTPSLRATVTETPSASITRAPQIAALERNTIITPRLDFLVIGSRCRKDLVKRTRERCELAPICCGSAPTLAMEPLWEPLRFPNGV